MANYSADIQIAVKGKTQLNALEKQLQRVNKLQTAIRQPATLRINSALALKQINAIEKRLKSLNRTVSVRVNERSSGGNRGNNGGDASNAIATGAATAGLLNAERQFRSIRDSLATASANGGELAKALNKVEKASAKVDDNQQRQSNNLEQIKDLTRQISIQEGQLKRLRGQQGTELDKAKRLLGETKNELKNVNASQRGLVGTADRWNKELREAQTNLDGVNRKLDTAARKSSRAGGFGKGLAGSLALSGLPGSQAIQQLGAGKILGGTSGLVGAGVGLIAGELIRIAKPAAIATAELQKLQLALNAVAGSDTQAALRAIERAVEDFNIPLQDATRNFTQLAAAGLNNGNSIEELETLYRGLAAATKATGGNAEDLNGVLRAATQVLSKNKVQAEELRGQIGDRLPGAFQLFAEATGRSAKELDKALEQGEVSAEEFVTKFGNFIKDKYEPAAKRIGDSPAEAGARLQKSLDDLNKAAGPALAELGAKFQDFADDVVQALEPVSIYLSDLFDLGQNGDLAAYTRNLERLAKLDATITNKESFIDKAVKDGASSSAIRQLNDDLSDLNDRRQELLRDINTQVGTLPVFDGSKQGTGSSNTTNTNTNTSSSSGASSALRDLERQRDALLEAGRAAGIETDERFKAVDAQEQLVERLQAQLAVANDVTDLGRAEKQLALDLLEIRQSIANKMADAYGNPELQEGIRLEQQLLEDLARTDFARPFYDAGFSMGEDLANTTRELTEVEQLFNDIGSSVVGGLVQGLTLAVTETDRLGEAMRELGADILEAVGQMLILKGLEMGLSALGGGDGVGLFSILSGGFGGARAEGGPVMPNRPYLVGEQGPELLVPSSSGTVIPNDVTQAMARYTPSGAGVSSTYGSQAAADDGVTGSALQTTFKLETKVINGVEYATVDQVRAMGAEATREGAKFGEQRALRRLQSSPGQRRKLGL